MQKTYEGSSLVVDPRVWIAEGMGDLPMGTIVFGVTDLQIQQISEDVYRVVVHFWSSSNEIDEANVLIADTGMDVFEYYQVNEITFQTRNTWREITKIEQLSMDLVNTYHIDYSNT